MSDEEAILAGELALGLLVGEERAAAMRLALADRGFAREVERWRERLAELSDAVHGIEPAPATEASVMRAIGRSSGGDGEWRWIAAVATIAAVVLLMVTLARPPRPPVPPPPAAAPSSLLVAVLKPDHAAAVGAVYDPVTRHVRFGAPVGTPAGRDLELWAIGKDGVPHAAGLLSRDASGRPTARSGVALVAGTTLAISVEPVGGSPKPTPTGPVIATGTLVAI